MNKEEIFSLAVDIAGILCLADGSDAGEYQVSQELDQIRKDVDNDNDYYRARVLASDILAICAVDTDNYRYNEDQGFGSIQELDEKKLEVFKYWHFRYMEEVLS